MTMLTEIRLDLASLRALYKSGKATPSGVIAAVYDRIAEGPLDPIRAGLMPREKALSRGRNPDRVPLASAFPLYGVPFPVDDGIDLAGLPTTACSSAKIVHNLIQAGAIPIGKTISRQSADAFAGFSLSVAT